MFSFLARHSRWMMAGIMGCVVISMFFYGTNSNRAPERPQNPDIFYKVGSKSVRRKLSKRQIESMKTFLSYDLGYGFNEVLNRQNIFADGFFLELVSSSLGKALAKKHFDLLKGDFSAKLEKNKRYKLYRHPSGKLNLEDKLEAFSPEIYEGYRKLIEKKSEVTPELLCVALDLANAQRAFTPKDMKTIVRVFMREPSVGHDQAVERKNFALFQAQNNEDLFGGAFMELFAQVMIEGGAFAKEQGFGVSYEEAEGIIMRRARDLIETKFSNIEAKDELVKLVDRYERELGLQRKDLVKAAQSVLSFQRLIKNVDNALLVDKMGLSKMFEDKVETLVVDVVKESSARDVSTVDDALELDLYLASVGDQETFLAVPEKAYCEQDLQEKAPMLFSENTVVKYAAVSKSELSKSVPIKKVWDFETSDAGWALVSEKFSLKSDQSSDARFKVLRALPEEKQKAIDSYAKEQLVSMDLSFVSKALEKKDLEKFTIHYNKEFPIRAFGKGIELAQLMSDLENVKEGEGLDFYTQDNEHYFKFVVVKKSEGKTRLSFKAAKESGFLAHMVEQKVKEAFGKEEISKKDKEKFLSNRAGKDVLDTLLEREKKQQYYDDHQKERLSLIKEGKLALSDDSILSEFNWEVLPEKVARTSNRRRYAKEEFFKMKEGEQSDLHYANGRLFYIVLKERKVNKANLKTFSKKVKEELVKEARKGLFDQLYAHIVGNELIELSRFEEKR